MVDFFNKFHELDMKICAKEARKLKSKIEFRRLMEKMKERFLDFRRFLFFKQMRFRPGIHQLFEDSAVDFFLRNEFLSQQFCCSKKQRDVNPFWQ